MISRTKCTKNVLVGSFAALVRDEIHCNEYPGTRRVMSVGYPGSKFSTRFNPTLLYGVMKSTLAWHVHRYQKLRWNNTVFVPLCLQYKTQSHSSHKNSGTLLAESLIWHVHCWKLPLPHNYGLSFIIFKVTYSLIKYKIHYRQAHKTLAHYGIPDVLVTDSRAQYAADSFHKLTEWWELSHLLSSPGRDPPNEWSCRNWSEYS